MTYDATANLSYTFDQENRITGANGYTYTYDGDGNRVRKSNSATSGTLYWYMSPGVVAETDLAGTLKSEYVFFDGERVARRDGATGTGGVFYYFSDHLKTASIITDSAGTIKAESDYYPWGGELQFVNNDPNDYKFTGKKRDAETGLDYFGARYYSNGLGRWVSADWSATPIPVPYADFEDPQTLNLYGYVRSLPTTRIDADGHDGGAVTAFFTFLGEVAEVGIAGPVLLAAAPGAVATALVASHDPVANHPADDPPSAANMMMDALNPPYVTVPAITSTNVDTQIPASTSQTKTIDTTTTQSKGSVPLAERDPKRRFTPQEAQQLKDKAQGKCATCDKTTTKAQPYTKGSKHSPREGQAGHKKAWSRGGKTRLKNGKWQCKGCNQKEGANSK